MDAGPSQRCAAPSHAPPSPPAALSPSPHAAAGATPAPPPATLRPAAGANASAVHSSSCVTRAKPPSSTKCASAARLCFSAAPTCRPAAAGACLCCSLLLGVQRKMTSRCKAMQAAPWPAASAYPATSRALRLTSLECTARRVRAPAGPRQLQGGQLRLHALPEGHLGFCFYCAARRVRAPAGPCQLQGGQLRRHALPEGLLGFCSLLRCTACSGTGGAVPAAGWPAAPAAPQRPCARRRPARAAPPARRPRRAAAPGAAGCPPASPALPRAPDGPAPCQRHGMSCRARSLAAALSAR